MKSSTPRRLKGKWRIVEMTARSAEHLDLIGPAYIEFADAGHGELAYKLTTPPAVAFSTAC